MDPTQEAADKRDIEDVIREVERDHALDPTASEDGCRAVTKVRRNVLVVLVI